MQYTERQEFKISKEQKQSLNTLKKNGVNLSEFIRSAIRAKINDEWRDILKYRKNKNQPDWI